MEYYHNSQVHFKLGLSDSFGKSSAEDGFEILNYSREIDSELNTNQVPVLTINIGRGSHDELIDYLSQLVDECDMEGKDKSLLCSNDDPHDSYSIEAQGDTKNCGKESEKEKEIDVDNSVEIVQSRTNEGTIFHGVTYLGCASISAPRSEAEIQRTMATLNQHIKGNQAMDVSVCIPCDSEGSVVVYEAETETEITHFKIHRILFCAKGAPETFEAPCFAFTCAHGGSNDTAMFQCHVFRCHVIEAVPKILRSFAAAFSKTPRGSSITDSASKEFQDKAKEYFNFEVTLEMQEDDGKGNYTTTPKDKTCFKLRVNVERKLLLTVSQTGSSSGKELEIERCFGILISPGRNVKQSDMHLLETMSMTSNGHGDRRRYTITAYWDPTESVFRLLNEETPRDMRVFMTIAVDLVIDNIQEPVRFVIETRASIYPQNERFWYFTRRQLVQQFSLCLRETVDGYEVLDIQTSGELDRPKMSINLPSLQSLTGGNFIARSPSVSSLTTPNGVDEDDDSDEPLMSGTGDVSKDCPEDELALWNEVLTEWRQMLHQKNKPKKLAPLVRRGIPEALRGEVWQLLCGAQNNPEMMDSYRVLINKDCSCEQVIERDINRTFPAHEFFRQTGGVGQDSLFKLSKAYAVYDDEIGYCQGLSFLAAALLLHMPEEQAFCVLVKIMFDYGMRDVFKEDFQVLHLRLYQLDKLMEDTMPDLSSHLKDLGIESHMFASQWFLTIFTAKFPLFLVFHILDFFLYMGVDTVFQVALALLTLSKKELLTLDFEGVLKYFRISLPKKYKSEETARLLIKTAAAIKTKKLKKYEKEYITMKEQEKYDEDPVTRLERENKALRLANLRLDRENDDLAHELVTSKIYLRNEVDKLTDELEHALKELETKKRLLGETAEDKKCLESEVFQVKEMLKRELKKSEVENTRNAAIIGDYKVICSQLSERLEKEQVGYNDTIAGYKKKLKSLGVTDEDVITPATPTLDETPPDLGEALHQLRTLELELAQTKLALVEAECKNQDLNHELTAVINEVQNSKNTWFHKTLTSLREAARKEVKEGKSDAT